MEGLAARYGGKGNPDYDAALELMTQDHKLGAQALYRAITATNQEKRATRKDTLLQERETRKLGREGAGAEAWARSLAPVTEPGLPGIPQVGRDDSYVPPTEETSRAPEISDILTRLSQITDPEVRGLAYKQAAGPLATRSAEETKPREPTVVRLAIQAAQGSQAAQAALDRLPQSQKNRALSQTDLAMQAVGEGPEAERAKRALELLKPEKDRNPTAASLAVDAAKGDLVALDALAKLQRPTQYQSIEEQLKLEGLTPGTLPYVTKRNDMLIRMMVPQGGAIHGAGTGLFPGPPETPGGPPTPPKAMVKGPELPIPSAAAMRVTNVESARSAAGRLRGLLGSKDVQKYQGPVAQWWVDSQRKAPGAALGEIPADKIDFDMDLGALRNMVLQLRSESQVTPSEAARIEDELPKRSSTPSNFARELARTEANLAYMERRLQELTLRGGSPRPAKPAAPAALTATPDPKGWKPVP